MRSMYSIRNIYSEALVATAISFSIAWLCAKGIQSKVIKSFLVAHLSYSPSQSAWEDVFDYQRGSRIRLKYKDSEQAVVGNLESMGEVDKDPWIALSYYALYEDISDQDPIYEQKDGKHFFMVNLNTIEYAEMWTNKGDKAIHHPRKSSNKKSAKSASPSARNAKRSKIAGHSSHSNTFHS